MSEDAEVALLIPPPPPPKSEQDDDDANGWCAWIAGATGKLTYLACLVSYIVIINVFHLTLPHGLYLQYDWYKPAYNATSGAAGVTPLGMYMLPGLWTPAGMQPVIVYWTTIPVFVLLILTYAAALFLGPEGVCFHSRPRNTQWNTFGTQGGKVVDFARDSIITGHVYDEVQVLVAKSNPLPQEQADSDKMDAIAVAGESYSFGFRFIANCVIYASLGPLTMYLLGYKSGYELQYSTGAFLSLAVVFGAGDCIMSELRVRVEAEKPWMQTPLLSTTPVALVVIWTILLTSIAKPMYAATSGGTVPRDLFTLVALLAADIGMESASFLLTIGYVFLQATWSIESQSFFVAKHSPAIRGKIHTSGVIMHAFKCALVCSYVMVLKSYAFGVISETVVL